MTSANATDTSHSSWSYDRDSKTLTLNGYNNNGNVGDKKAGIYAEEDLDIVTVGTNDVSNNSNEPNDRAIKVNGTLIFKGNGTMNAKGGKRSIVANNVTIESGTVKVSDGDYGICAEVDDVTINGGVVNGNGNQIGLQSNHDVIINNGTVTASSTSGNFSAIKATNDVIIKKGTVTVKHTGSGGSGILAGNGVTIQGGSVETTGYAGINAGSVTIKAGSVKATGTLAGIAGPNGVDISGGTIDATATASGDQSYGIYGNEVIIKGGNVTASGFGNGILINVKNSISGIGWTNTAGTEGKASISISTEGQSLNYKKVQFPDAKEPSKVTNAPKANDLTYNGKAQELVTTGIASGGKMNYALGINSSTAPTDGWSASIPTGTDVKTYYVWYKAVGDATHTDSDAACVTVTIAAKPAPTEAPTSVPTATPKPVPKTGDSANPALWLGLIFLGLFGAAGTVLVKARKR